ncbi:Predicted PurR-regulated permease PerM [Devosia enhydra]|uniref:Predicted PurR-regulated permease PerM n=1 Tax=Devosia enhydra TaxID=665118 RepID=A0A1K2HU86_9HYPH|nr:AI-2E family transporter [Devosia enhydra]SFZ81922.1 Predicted PurR-regulated permease PerM [Devosia enhydra]
MLRRTISPAHAMRLERMQASTNFERVLANAAQLSLVLIGFVVLLAALKTGQVILAPVSVAIVIGLMFGPVADMMEKRGVPPFLSAGVVVLLLLGLIAAGGFLFAGPLSEWIERAPAIWEKLRSELTTLRQPLEALGAIQQQVQGAIGGGGEGVTVTMADDGSAVRELAFLAPAVLAQIGIFLASLYFFMATRSDFRISVLSLCVTRRMRWRTAHVFRDVEQKVSKFLLSITMINAGVGVVTTLVMWALGVPSPMLWGALAFVANYIPFVGQFTMLVLLFAVGLGTRTGIEQAVIPVFAYWVVTLIESQLITPHVLGRTITLNPFMIFLSLAFWLWAWGPVGGVVAIPSLLILYSIVHHILPSRPLAVRKPKANARLLDREATKDERAAEAKLREAEAEVKAGEPALP